LFKWRNQWSNNLFIERFYLFQILFFRKPFEKYGYLGEHYTEVCTSFKSFLSNELKFDLKSFGYMKYAYGLEEHRKFFKKLIIRDHQLD
jgi:hypothetical protein